MSLEEELALALNQERISAAASGYTLDEEAFKQDWLETATNPDEKFLLQLKRSRNAPIAPEDLTSWNPEITKVGMYYEFLKDDISALRKHGFTHIGHFTSIPDRDIPRVYKSLSGLGKHMTLDHFKDNIKLLREEFPKSHYFLAQPLKQTEPPKQERLVGRPDGGRDGSGMFM